jgi:hypothetical protein
MKPTMLAVAVAACVVPLSAQPGGPPPILQIIREVVKEGKGAAHRKVEHDYASTFRKNKYPFNYVALTTVSGPGEVWFVEPYPSFAAIEESDKLSDKQPLKGEIELVEGHDGELRTSSRTMTAVLRKELCYIPENGITLPKTRYVMIGSLRVRLGHDEDFMAGGKMILDAYRKAKMDATVFAYQVIAGAPDGLYLFIAPMASLSEMDKEPEREKAMVQAMGEENFKRLMKSTGDVFQTMENTIFAVSPEMSYVSKETEDADPAFWRPKASAAAPAAKPKEKAGQ